MKRERLTANERKLEIQNIALEVFTIKGYKNTSMHDLVQATGLSAGGLYHHYKSTSEILYDMMIRGCKYREDIIKKKIAEIPNPLGIEVLAEQWLIRRFPTIYLFQYMLCSCSRCRKMKPYNNFIKI